MTADIHTLRNGEHLVSGGTPDSVIGMLERFLVEAQRGEIAACAIVTVDPSGYTYHEEAHRDDHIAWFLLIAGASMLLRRLQDKCGMVMGPSPVDAA